MDYQMAYMQGQKDYRRYGSKARCQAKGQAARYWRLGFNFRRNSDLSVQGKFRGRFNEPREKGGIDE